METTRQESHELIRQLCKMVNDTVTIRLFGGFAVQGTLVNVDDELAYLTASAVFSPGSDDPLVQVTSIIVNLEGLTSIGKPLNICC